MSENDFEEQQAKHIPEPPGIQIPDWLGYVIPFMFVACMLIGVAVVANYVAIAVFWLFEL